MSFPSANDLYHTAQDLIRMGQPVFPCYAVDTGGHKAKQPIGSFVPNGVLDATLDRERVKRWLKRKPDMALGIATGVVWDVLDVDLPKNDEDEREDGRKHMHRLTELGLLNGCQRVVRTPSGGFHLYFKSAPGLTNKAAGATMGLDVRAAGGYVLASPSYIETEFYSGAYVDEGETEGATDEPLWWDMIVGCLAPRNDSGKPIELLPSDRWASIGALREWLSHARVSERNHSLFWTVCRCIENGIDPHEMVEAATLTGLGEEEILKTVEQAMIRAGLTEGELKTEAEVMFDLSS